MNALTFDAWTVVADRPAETIHGGWTWRAPWIAHETLIRMADRDDAIVMQRLVGARREVVARLAGPHWKRLQVRFSVQRDMKRAA